jgi:hypothetical protein
MELGSKHNNDGSQLDSIYIIKQNFKTLHIQDNLGFFYRS